MNLNSKIIFSETIFAQKVDEEMVLLDMNSENYFGLDEVATDIWEILQENNNLEFLIKKLLSLYDIEEEKLQEDIFNFLKELEKRKFISIQNS